MKVQLEKVVKRFDTHPVVDGIDLEIKSGELFFLLGTSGCGKTTLLRLLAGFYEPEKGRILFGDRPMNGVPPYQRNTALVFQNYALWPHLNVFENVAYGLRVRKVPEPEIRQRVAAALDKVKMRSFAERKTPELSGGQQQRVALVRAMVVNPDLLLLDEPLSNLDAKLRVELRDEIKQLHAETQITSVYVTHDQEEALSLASRIAVMNAGRIQQIGTPFEVYNHPATAFVAAFVGSMNLYGNSSALGRKLGVQASPQWGFRPEKVRIVSHGIPVKVISSSYLGSSNQLTLETTEGETIKASTPDYVAIGTLLQVEIPSPSLLQFPE